jgi:hypothetical protein
VIASKREGWAHFAMLAMLPLRASGHEVSRPKAGDMTALTPPKRHQQAHCQTGAIQT